MTTPAPIHFTKILVTAFVAGALFAPSRARASDEPATYAIEKSSPPVTLGGAPGRASLTVVGKNGWHINTEAPISVALTAGPGVTLAKAKLTRSDLAESSKEKARFDIAFSTDSPGRRSITADTRFVMCQEQACKPVKEVVTLDVVAVANAPTPVATLSKSKGDKADKADKVKAAAGRRRGPARPASDQASP